MLTETVFKNVEGPRLNKAYQATWVITAAWAHPLWSQYTFWLYDLTTPIHGMKTDFKFEGATHELMVYALDPDHPFKPGNKFKDIKTLRPANHGYQFKADNDQMAHDVVEKIISLIHAGRLSPDTDWRRVWDKMFFGVGQSLKKHTTTADIEQLYKKLGIDPRDKPSSVVDFMQERKKRNDG